MTIPWQVLHISLHFKTAKEISMRKRRIVNYEQPEVLTQQLGKARVTDDEGQIIESAPAGVPHGVTHAMVEMEGVRVEGRKIYFCESQNYRVRQSTLDGADNGAQPPVEASDISTSRWFLPGSGYYNVRARVALNGSRHIHIERFERAAKPVPMTV